MEPGATANPKTTQAGSQSNIVAAALRLRDLSGKVVTISGVDHGDAWNKAVEAGLASDDKPLPRTEAGFLTQDGQFVTRQEAGPAADKRFAAFKDNPLRDIDQGIIQQRALNEQAGVKEEQPNYYKTVYPHDEGIPQPIRAAFERTMGPTAPPKEGFLTKAAKGLRRFFVPFDDLMGKEPVGGPGTPSLTEWHGPTRDAFRQLRPLDRIASQEALESISSKAGLLKNPEDNDLFLKALWTRELAATSGREGDSYSLPGFTREEARQLSAQTQAVLDPHLQANPHVLEAVNKAFETNRELGKQLMDRNLIPKDARQDYMHHMVMQHMNEYLGGRGRGEQLPNIARTLKQGPEGPAGVKERQPGSLKARSGLGVTDINRNYWELQYQYERAIRSAIKAHDALQDVVRFSDLRMRPKPGFEQARAEYLQTGIVPKGYSEYNLRSGFTSFSGRNPAEILFGEQLDASAADIAQSWGIKPERINALLEALMPEQAPPQAGMAIVPDEVAKALQKASADRRMIEPNIVTKTVNWWKALVLMKKFFYYNIHNSLGDIQRWVGQFGPSMPFDLKTWKWAYDETKAAYSQNPSELWEHAHDRNLVRSGRTGIETSQINAAPQLAHLYDAGEQSWGVARTLAGIKKLLSYLPRLTTMREDIMRMYALKFNADRMLRGEQPLEGVADIRGLQGLDTKSLKDLNGNTFQVDRALEHITRESLFDYSDFTGPEDKWLRNGLMPFYSWAKKDIQFWPKLAMKAVQGRASPFNVAAGAGTRAATLGFTTLVAYAALTRVWNSYIMGDAEEHLPEYMQKGNHLILPDLGHWTSTGKLRPKMVTDPSTGQQRVAVVRMTDAADDFLAWTGTDGIAPDLKAVFDGRMSVQEYLTRRGEDAIFKDGVPLPAAVQKTSELLSPLVQVPLAGLGYKTFPHALTPVEPGERGKAMADAAGLGDFPGVDQLAGPPEKSLLDFASQTGYRSQAMSPYPTILQDDRQDLARKRNEIEQTTNEIRRIAEGVSSSNLESGEREKRVQQLIARRQSMIADYQKRARRLVDLSGTYLPQR